MTRRQGVTTVPSAGVGLKPQHFAEALAAPADGLWFEVHPENYMVEGGARLAWLAAIRARHPVALHGVALSLAAAAPPDAAHLARLTALERAFQDAFTGALLAREQAESALPAVTALASQPGFAIYRNTVLKGCVDALQANYPAVARIVGKEWFRDAAALYARASLPAHPALVRYGDGFADFLAQFPPAAELPYLPAVARLDRLWTEAHVARDAPCVDAAAVASLPLDDPSRIMLKPHPAARWAWFHTLPAYTLWQRNRASGAFDDSPIEWVGEGVLIVRPRDHVRSIPLDPAGCALLDACAEGRSVAEAAAAVLAIGSAVDFTALLGRLTAAGAFAHATATPRVHATDDS